MAAMWNKQHGSHAHPTLHRRIDGAHGGAVSAIHHQQMGSNDFVLTGGEDGMVKAWSKCGDCQLPWHSADMDQSRRVHSSASTVTSVCIEPVTNRVCAGCNDGYVRIWDLLKGCATDRLGPHGHIETVKLLTLQQSLEGNKDTLMSGSNDGFLYMWDLRSSVQTVSFKAHPRSTLSVAAMGYCILSSSSDGTASFWDIRKPTPVAVHTCHLFRTCPEEEDQIQEITMPLSLDDISRVGLLHGATRSHPKPVQEYPMGDGNDSWLALPGQLFRYLAGQPGEPENVKSPVESATVVKPLADKLGI